MKILVLENPEEHRDFTGNRARTLYPSVEDSIRTECGESKLVLNLNEADTALFAEKYDGVIIHHFSYKDLSYLRSRHPDIKFAAISATIVKREECKPGSLAEAMISQLGENYDFVLPDYDKSIWAMIRSLKQNS